jgi:hypothetical protein
MTPSKLDMDLEKLYSLSVKLWFSVADDHMLRCGHPGMPGKIGQPENNTPEKDQQLLQLALLDGINAHIQGAKQALKKKIDE